MRHNNGVVTKARLAVGALVAIALFAGCAGASDEEEQAAATETEPDRDARLVVASQAAVTQWDVARNIGGPEPAFLKMVYETLTDVDPDNNLVPALATEWYTDDSGLTYTFELRGDVTFTDGTEFTAEVAKQNIERALTLEGSTLSGAMSNIKSVEAVDADTLNITQESPDTTLPALLSDRYGMMMSPASWESGEVTEPIGSGPYVVVDEQQQVSLTLDRNEDYRDVDSVLLAGVDVNIMEDPVARLNALKTNAADMAMVEAEQMEEAESLEGFSSFLIKGRAMRLITVNPELEPAFQDPDVRRALNVAINREGIVEGVLFGAGEPAYQIRPEGAIGYSAAYEPTLMYDPEEARRLLDEAGYGDSLSFEFITQPKYQKEAEAIQADWAAVGVDVTVQVLPGLGASSALWYDKTAVAGLTNYDGRLDPAIALKNLFMENQVNNPGNVTDDALTEVINQSFAETDPAKRSELFDQAAQMIDAVPLGVWPVVYGYQAAVYSDSVIGMEPYQAAFPVLRGVGIAR